MKELYLEPEMDVTTFSDTDVISTSDPYTGTLPPPSIPYGPEYGDEWI